MTALNFPDVERRAQNVARYQTGPLAVPSDVVGATLQWAWTGATIGVDAIDHGLVRALWEKATAVPPVLTPPVWIHAAVHPANAVYDDRLVGVIDFGDLCDGDCATDLAGALISLPYSALGAFFGAYGDVGDATLQRTIGWPFTSA